MRVLLDNNVTHRLAQFLTGHEIVHAREMGWAGLQNGDLIAAAESADFEVLLTADKNMRYQQNLTGRTLTIMLLSNYRITLNHLTPLVPIILRALDESPRGSFLTITTLGIVSG